MRNSRQRAWRGLLVALVFASGSPALGGAFRCCMADGHGVPEAAAVPVPQDAHTQDAHTQDAHAQHTHHGHEHTASAPVGDVHGGQPATPVPNTEPCTCIGPCAGAAVAVAATAPADIPRAVVRAVAVRQPSSPRSWVADDRQSFLLPFANGPPRAYARL